MLDQYTINGVFDEMFEAGRVPRPHYNAVVDRVVSLDPAVIQRRRHLADLSFRNLGITFTVYSEKSGVERIFPFDLIPRIIPAAEWETIEAGPGQRHPTRNLFFNDTYRDQKNPPDKIIPADMIYSAKKFRPGRRGLRPPCNV